MEDYLFQELKDSFNPPTPEIADSKQTLFLPDTNNGGYQSGNVTFDLSGWSNSNLFVDYSNSFLTIPYIFVCDGRNDADTADQALGADCNPKSIGLKNGFYNLISNVQITVGGNTVVDSQELNNVYVAFKTITSWNQLTVDKYGTSLGVAFDGDGVSFSKVGSANGDGFSNNKDSIDPDKYLINDQQNVGFDKRKENNTAFDRLSQCPGVSENANGEHGMSVWNKAGNRMSWAVLAKIRLSDITDFFAKAGMLRNVAIRANLTINACTFKTKTIAGAVGPPAIPPTMTLTSYTQRGGSSCPVIISSLNQGVNGIGPENAGTAMNAAGTYTITTGVVDVLGVKHPAMNTCRWYAAAYKLNSYVDTVIAQKYPVKPIRYQEVFNFRVNNVIPGSFQSLIGNGYPNIKSVICQVFATGKTPDVFATTPVADYQSPFSSAPGTTMPFSIIDDFNVILSGKPVFTQNYKYDFESFMFEVASINSLNSGANDQLCSGMVDEKRWNYSNRYLVADCSRHTQASNVPMSVMIQGSNKTAFAVDLVVHIVYEKMINIDLMTGAVTI